MISRREMVLSAALLGTGLREQLRVLGASELSPLKNSLQPAFHDWQSLNDDLLGGLDFLLAEMGARHPDHRIQRGETDYVGDPPHEPQGWYSDKLLVGMHRS